MTRIALYLGPLAKLGVEVLTFAELELRANRRSQNPEYSCLISLLWITHGWHRRSSINSVLVLHVWMRIGNFPAFDRRSLPLKPGSLPTSECAGWNGPLTYIDTFWLRSSPRTVALPQVLTALWGVMCYDGTSLEQSRRNAKVLRMQGSIL